MHDVGDVLIVGAGPVGVLTALALVQQGVSVAVIEAEADVADAPRATIYFASTLIALEELGLLDDLARISYRYERFACRAPALGFVQEIPLSVLSGVSYEYNLSCGQNKLAHIAIRHARTLGADFRFGHRLIALSQDDERAVATVETSEGERRLAASWVIGADGGRSTVRKLAGMEFEGMTWPNRFVATNLAIDLAAYGYAPGNFICDPVYGGVMARIDVAPHWRVTYQEHASLPAETYLERMPERFAHILPQGASFELLASSPYAIHQRCAARLREGRILLAGDAAHVTNPLGGLGLTSGLWDGMILADVLAAVVRGDADARILDRYSDERRRIFWEVTNPAACENKRMVEEADPERRKADIAAFAAMAQDPAQARSRMCFPFKVIGDVLREGSRWKSADPTPAAGIDLESRGLQVR
jgi:2-polyprenyl-6-methoxyphenol hydroxylase-like FAD-dependent oxidoreductase